jgi:hypothetical protein
MEPAPGRSVTCVQLDGFSVEATDGSIGKIDEATYDVGSSYMVVDTGPWIFGKKVMLPASIIERVDYDGETVYVSVTKERIKNAFEFNETTYRDDAYRSQLGGYYGRDSSANCCSGESGYPPGSYFLARDAAIAFGAYGGGAPGYRRPRRRVGRRKSVSSIVKRVFGAVGVWVR